MENKRAAKWTDVELIHEIEYGADFTAAKDELLRRLYGDGRENPKGVALRNLTINAFHAFARRLARQKGAV